MQNCTRPSLVRHWKQSNQNAEFLHIRRIRLEKIVQKEYAGRVVTYYFQEVFLWHVLHCPETFITEKVLWLN